MEGMGDRQRSAAEGDGRGEATAGQEVGPAPGPAGRWDIVLSIACQDLFQGPSFWLQQPPSSDAQHQVPNWVSQPARSAVLSSTRLHTSAHVRTHDDHPSKTASEGRSTAVQLCRHCPDASAGPAPTLALATAACCPLPLLPLMPVVAGCC